MRHVLVFLSIVAASGAGAQECGGEWRDFLDGVRKEALDRGIKGGAVDAVLAQATLSEAVLKQDRTQGTFKQSFRQFSQRAVSADRLSRAAQMRKTHGDVFAMAKEKYGVPEEVILAFWAMETDFGAFMGNFSTVSALATLAHDCRRPTLFRPQLIAAMELVARGDIQADVTGAWAGEIGHVQMLPGDILAHGIDGDEDGLVKLKDSAPDAILSAAALLSHHGWREAEPWLVEVTTPEDLDWSLSGLPNAQLMGDWAGLGVLPLTGEIDARLEASLVLPMGHKGPKFLVFRNFKDVYLNWNKSLTNTLTAAYLATRIGGADPYRAGDPGPILDGDQIIALQTLLEGRGHDVGGIDGIIGAATRAAVRAEQKALGLPADGWPTPELLAALN